MKFTKESQLVKIWVSLVLAGAYTKEQVPRLFNLKEVTLEVLTELEGSN